MRRYVSSKLRLANNFLVDLDLFREPQIVRNLHGYNTVKDSFISVVAFKLLPLGLV